MRWSERPPVVRPRFLSLQPFRFGPRSLSVAVAHLVLVRPVRRAIITTAVTLSFCVVAGCETILVQDGIRISGRIHDISRSDIHAAIVADIAKRPELRGGKPSAIYVTSRDEVQIYWGDGHDILKRVRGGWRYTATLVTLS
jgi:hypothetical protein